MLVRALIVIAAGLSWPLAAAAEGGGSEPGAESPCVVLVLPVGAGPDVELAVRAHLVDVAARVVVVHSDVTAPFREHLARAGELAAANDAIGVVWVDLSSAEGDVLLYLFNREGTRTMVRRLEEDETTPAARVEELGLVTGSMISAVVEGGTIDVRPPEVEAPEPVAAEPARTEPPPPVEEPERGRRRRFDDLEPRPPFIEVTAGYAGQLLHEALPWQNGVRTTVAWLSPSGRWSTGVAYVFWVAAPFEVEGVRLRLQRHSWEVFGSFSVPLRVLRVGGELAFFGELTQRETQEIQGTGAEPESDVILGLAARIRIHVQLWRWLGLSGIVGVDGLVRRVRYLVDTPDSEVEVLLDPLLIRPMVGIALSGRFG